MHFEKLGNLLAALWCEIKLLWVFKFDLLLEISKYTASRGSFSISKHLSDTIIIEIVEMILISINGWKKTGKRDIIIKFL